MLKPRSSPCTNQQRSQPLPQRFSLLLWNIHKENQDRAFITTLETLLSKHPSDLLLFQEFKYPKQDLLTLPQYTYTLASNIETNKSYYGVLSAAKNSFTTLTSAITQQQELFIATHKSFLITQHQLADKRPLYLVNLHAINFVTLKSFREELQKLEDTLVNYEGAMIIAGDFNSWSKGRVLALQKFQDALGLQKAEISASEHIKAIFFKPIDHLYYRDLTLLSAEAINTQKVSDHNPIHATFQLEEMSKLNLTKRTSL